MTLPVDGKENEQSLTVLKDPDSAGTLLDIAVWFAMMQELRDDINSAESLSQQIDTVRSQLKTLMEKAVDDLELKEAAAELEATFTAPADSLVQQKPGGFFMWPGKLISKLVHLATHVQSSDYPPTQQAREALEVLQELLGVAEAEFERLVSDDLGPFNGVLGSRGLEPIGVGEPGG